MSTLYKYSIRKHNTFGIDVAAEQLVLIRKEDDLIRFLAKNETQPLRILGGGSNILFTGPVKGILLKNEILGKRILKGEGDAVIVEVGGGENWHEFVLWTLKQDIYGLENLSLIPGTVGASPVQNIGAYGVELEERFHSLDAIHLATGKRYTFTPSECGFSYRNSIFKQARKGEYFITTVRFSLTTTPDIRLEYGDIRDTLQAMKVGDPSPVDISNAVIAIRRKKLPDPEVLGNAGSFFKNPIISEVALQKLLANFPDMPSWPVGEGMVKVPAGWLIDRAGWKGKRVGDAGVHEQHALVLVNYGQATGAEIAKLAFAIQSSVKDIYGIQITPEVNIW